MHRRMTREIWGLLAGGVLFCSVAALLITAAGAQGSSSAAQYEYGAPAPGAPPTLSGTMRSGATLTASNGAWTSSTTITSYIFRWLRCDANGKQCATINGATGNSYSLTDADVGHRIEVQVLATNAVGTTAQTSSPSGVVAAAPATTTILARDVVLPNRLVIDKIAYSQNPIRSRQTPTQIRVHVAAGGKSVQSALVYVLGVPYNRIANAPEVATDASGWATVSLSPLRAFPRTGYLVLFVRAHVQGQDLLGGTSTRRIVQATIGAPNGT